LTHPALDELKQWHLGYIFQIHELMETDSQF
jgi:ABC-type lipoprotein export system ATPase subunit